MTTHNMIDSTALYLCLRRQVRWDLCFRWWEADERIKRLNAYLDGLNAGKQKISVYNTRTKKSGFVDRKDWEKINNSQTVKRDAKGRFARKGKHK